MNTVGIVKTLVSPAAYSREQLKTALLIAYTLRAKDFWLVEPPNTKQ